MVIGTGIEIGAGAANTTLSPAQLLKQLAPHDWWDFTDAASLSLSGDSVNAVVNKGQNSDALSHMNGGFIRYDGQKAVCNGSQTNYAAGNAGDRNFLHDGSGAEIYVVHEQAAATNEQFFVLTNDVSGSSVAPGLRMSSYQTGGVKEYITRFGFGANHLFNQAEDDTLTLGTPMITSLAVDVSATQQEEIVLAEDGVPAIEQAGLDLLSDQDHTGPFKALVSYKGNVWGILVFDRSLSARERAVLQRSLRQYYGLNRQANVTLLIGASNAEGLGSGGALSAQYQGVIERAYIYAHRDGNNANPIQFYPHEQANSHVDFTSSSAGLDLSLMNELTQNSGAKEFLLKSTVSGSDLYAQWNPTYRPSFSVAWDEFAQRLVAMQNMLAQAGFVPSYRGCVVGLGENDASANFRANEYEANQLQLNAQLRSLTQPDLRVVMVACSTQEPEDTVGRSDGNMGLQSTVRAAQNAVEAADAQSIVYQPVASTAIGWNEASPNGIHYDMPTLELMGVEIAGLLD